jgi:type IV pilus assembly protein PilN
MIRINLLPFRAARKKENIRRQVSVFLLTFLFITVALFYYNSSLSGQIETLSTIKENKKKEIKKYNKVNNEIKEIKKKLSLMNKKMDIVKKIGENRKEPVILLDTMTKMIIPKRMWFTKFSSIEDIVTIMGIALDDKTVADFMTRLQTSKLFTSVNLKNLKQHKIKEKNLILKSFDITLIKTSSEKEEIKKTKPGKVAVKKKK